MATRMLRRMMVQICCLVVLLASLIAREARNRALRRGVTPGAR